MNKQPLLEVEKLRNSVSPLVYNAARDLLLKFGVRFGQDAHVSECEEGIFFYWTSTPFSVMTEVYMDAHNVLCFLSTGVDANKKVLSIDCLSFDVACDFLTTQLQRIGRY